MGVRHGTIIDALLAHAERDASRPFITFDPIEGDPIAWTYGDTLQAARRAAGALAAHGLTAGDRLVIVGRNDANTASLLLGAMGSGILPAIVHPPLRADVDAARAQMRGITGRAEPKLVVAPTAMHAAFPEGTRVLSARKALDGDDESRDLIAPDPTDVAYLQFSSGTTGAQKAVMIPAGALARNADATGTAANVHDDDTWLIWLPLYHDMGLMSGFLVPLYFGHRSVLLPPQRFVERPMMWMQAVSGYRATTTVAPNFAYALTSRRATPERLEGLDLSCLRVAYNGAETVSADTVKRFEKTFAPAGLRANTVYPVYGLAEFTLSAVFWRVNEPIRVDEVERNALALGVAEPVSQDERRVVRLVSVGGAIDGHSCRVVAEDGSVCGNRKVGELQMKGPSAMVGYLGDAEASAAAFDGDWLRTGDMAYVAGGDLFICGRKKDIIIRYGENFYPMDLEAAASSAPGVKPGRLTVLGVEDPSMATERVWLILESKEVGDSAYALAQSVRSAVIESAGFKFDGVAVVSPGWIEKTSSGKIRRFVCRGKLGAMFRQGKPPPSVGRWP